jgi:hypothetical protein
MRLAIMQPYFLPYIGYFQLIAAADVFILYDNIKYTKKGWINRNRMLVNGGDTMFSLPLKKGSDSFDVIQREIAADFHPDKLLSQLKGAYARAPFFSEAFPLLEKIIRNDDRNLFSYIHNSIVEICRFLDINTEIRISSDLDINSLGGVELYSKEIFSAVGIELKFIKSKPFEYSQFDAPFVPWLSIVDVLMFNSLDSVRECISTNCELI